MAASFDTPQSSTNYDVATTGTVAGWSTARVMVTLTVSGTNAARTATQQVFYREMNYNNTATSTALAISTTVRMAISPKLHGNETVATVVNFGY
ncbi:hypothetical protein LL033_16425 [Clostridium estertheticum]|uniref:hypothetical protein n=1 Tax=Clostridium estertheticum TaxID=238834 RepID=UPI001C0CE398|nr:hypothetical protein [Clostridium estertheticum]MBU3218384.1 hypothetical protein [Clostridium estertheticum]WAG54211.1 hypothetical protein LL033_16425 [Clostridium estertheticum]